MMHRTLVTSTALAVLALSAAVPAGQRVPAGAVSGPEWQAPRTPDGHPDLRGYWTNDTVTPLERPDEFGDKAVLTADEAKAYADKRIARFLAQPSDSIHYDDAIWQGENYATQAHRRTSLIVEPPTGKLPPLTPDAARRAAEAARDRRTRGPADSVQSRTLAERCITWGNVGPPMVPPTYNANLQILEAPDLVVIRHEMMHDVRIVPLDGRPHLGPGVQRLAGDSRGRWEGDTLVVDTTNFTDKTNFRGPPLTTRQDITASDALHVVERFTLVDPDTIRYEFTVEDPLTWVSPWSGEMPFRRFEGPIYEYACHEGNYGLANILRAARVEEAAAR